MNSCTTSSIRRCLKMPRKKKPHQKIPFVLYDPKGFRPLYPIIEKIYLDLKKAFGKDKKET